MQIILRDYIGAVLHLVQDGQQWRLNPLEVSPVLHTQESIGLTYIYLARARY
jgi:hypothetical protein